MPNNRFALQTLHYLSAARNEAMLRMDFRCSPAPGRPFAERSGRLRTIRKFGKSASYWPGTTISTSYTAAS